VDRDDFHSTDTSHHDFQRETLMPYFATIHNVKTVKKTDILRAMYCYAQQ